MPTHLHVFILLLLILQVCSRVTKEVKEECEKHAPNKKCYIKCLFHRGGYLGADGQVLIHNVQTDNLALGNGLVYRCLEKVDKVKDCDHVTELLDCFTLKLQ